jgi:hypothetical protein
MLILLKAHYLAMVRAGAKRSTIRPWTTSRGLHVGRRCRIGNYRDSDPVVITAVESRTLSELTAGEVRADGFDSLAAFRAAFAELYPDATPETRVWVIGFRPEHPAQ